jgi:hypothetical protein
MTQAADVFPNRPELQNYSCGVETLLALSNTPPTHITRELRSVLMGRAPPLFYAFMQLQGRFAGNGGRCTSKFRLGIIDFQLDRV